MGLFINLPAIVVLGLLLTGLERLRPLRRQPVFRRGWRTDVLHLVVTHTLEVLLTVAIALPLMRLAQSLRPGVFVELAASMPKWLLVAVFLFLADGVGTLWHRFEHRGGFFWRVHAVHHSSEQLDWLASARRHPLGTSMGRGLSAGVLVFLGAPAEVLAPVAGLVGLWGVLLHANVRLPLGPLRHVIATPQFHRRHHAKVAGPGGNFAGLFPVWDRLLGTHLGDGDANDLGCDAPVPEGYLAQLALKSTRVSAR